MEGCIPTCPEVNVLTTRKHRLVNMLTGLSLCWFGGLLRRWSFAYAPVLHNPEQELEQEFKRGTTLKKNQCRAVGSFSYSLILLVQSLIVRSVRAPGNEC